MRRMMKLVMYVYGFEFEVEFTFLIIYLFLCFEAQGSCRLFHQIIMIQLYNALDNRDQTIADLEKKLESIINSTEGVERHLRLESDLEQARNEIIQQRQVIAELEAQVGENALQNDNDAADLKDMRDVVEMKNKIVETLRKQLLEAEQNLDKIKNQNKSGKGEVYRLETENLR